MTVLCFTWAAYAARHPGLHFIAMNYTVHAGESAGRSVWGLAGGCEDGSIDRLTFLISSQHHTQTAVMYSYFFLMAIDAKPKWLKYVRPPVIPLLGNSLAIIPRRDT